MELRYAIVDPIMEMMCEFWDLKVRCTSNTSAFYSCNFFLKIDMTGIISFIGYIRRNRGRRRWGRWWWLQCGGEWGRGSRATHYWESSQAPHIRKPDYTWYTIHGGINQVIAVLIEEKLTGDSCHNLSTPAGFTLQGGLPVCTYCTAWHHCTEALSQLCSSPAFYD